MTPATLARLSGLLHHIPDARDLRILGADGTPSALHPAAAEVYAAVPELVEFARQRDADATGKTEAIRHHHADTVRLREVLAILQAINLNESPPCPQCGGDLRSDTEEEDGFTCYFCDCPRCGWSNEGDDSPLTFASAPWTKRVAAAIRQAREVSHG